MSDHLKPYQFKPGESGNPSGMKPLPPDIRALLHERSSEYKRKFLYWCDAPIKNISQCEGATWEITAMDRMICSAIIQAMNGNNKAFNAILDRILGKPKQEMELTGADGAPLFKELTPAEIVEMGMRLVANRRETD